MATIILSPLLVDIRGKVQDCVYSIWKGRNYIRSRVIPSNPKSAAQIKQRAIMTAAVTNWQQLHADLVLRWNKYGTPYRVSGYNSFTDRNASTAAPNGDGSNARMELAAALYPSLARPTPLYWDLAGVTFGAGAAGEIEVDWTVGTWTVDDSVYIACWAEAAITYYGAPAVAIAKVAANAGSYFIGGLGNGLAYTCAIVAHKAPPYDTWTPEQGEKAVTSGAP